MDVELWARLQALEIAVRETAKQLGVSGAVAASLAATKTNAADERAEAHADALRAELDRLAAHFAKEA